MVALLLAIEFLDVIVYTVSKAAMTKGMNDFVFVMYSNAFASFLLLPLTVFFHRYLRQYFFSFPFTHILNNSKQVNTLSSLSLSF